ncbi:hypothetical protein PLICRDRAFT_174334 [Plicaturopsis crispa FD-325 SS-3]|nr:hypothetical protein PLICRDRAFT_174334 [Plicaturopsis crispa FD-325 SS-3]
MTSPSTPNVDETVRLGSEYVLAMHDYSPDQASATCLAFRAGQVIHVLNRDSSGWWDGELEGRRGWFPSNYVNADMNTSAEEDTTRVPRQRHAHTVSTASAPTWPRTPSPTGHNGYVRHDHRPSVTDALGSDIDTYCPPLMVPLLHGLSLLQNAVRTNRIAHFQPSTACIISCVRSVLSATECLPRESPVLKQHPILSQERKRILSVLASLVAQAKKASEEMDNEDQRETEVEMMLRMGGQVFAHVRRFLAVAVQCGVDLPEKKQPGVVLNAAAGNGWYRDGSDFQRQDMTPTPYQGDEAFRMQRNAYNQKTPVRNRPSTPGSAMRAKSLGDLKSQRRITAGDDSAPLLPHRSVVARSKLDQYIPKESSMGHRQGMLSVSSTSSSSSFSSASSVGTPASPAFPAGPSSTAQVMEALRHTHDNYLSTIAAFIGHAHSHSRSSHASSTGHMYDLVREVVEMVCKLLTIVEAVMHHPDVPAQRIGSLRAAKEGLYNVTSSLAESVRLLTIQLPPMMTEEEEKTTLLRSATGALKAGADCVASVKMCLHRSVGEKQFIIHLPTIKDSGNELFTPNHFSKSPLGKAASMHALQNLYRFGTPDDDEDMTIQAQTPSSGRIPNITVREAFGHPVDVFARSPIGSPDTSPSSPEATKRLPSPLHIDRNEFIEPDQLSPTSFARTERTDDDRTTWEGSMRTHQSAKSVEEKIYNGRLPSVPPEPVDKNGTPYMLSHDYPLEDVAYNSEGHLVGATLDVLVEKMTPHDSIVDPAFSAVFFLTFRLFSTPFELVSAIITRYNILPPSNSTDEDIRLWQRSKGIPVRLRVSNFIKLWLEMYWRPSVDDVVLDMLADFTRNALAPYFAGPSQRILELIDLRIHSPENAVSPKGDRIRDPGMSINPPSLPSSEIPRPMMTKSLLASLRSRNFSSIVITDFDALELARQMSIMESKLYCAIQPDEVMETGQAGAKTPNVKAVTSLSTVITGWVAESILNEQDTKKRTILIKFFIKVADRCASMHNYSTPRSILAALDSSTISRLHQTWQGLPQKNKSQLESLRRLADHGRNYREYRQKLRNTAPPAVPFLGLYLTDVTFCREGNPSHRASPIAPDKKLLNFNKYHKLARIVQDMQRFQVSYNLKAIPEVQEYLNVLFEKSKHHGDLNDLYRRSLMVEPKQPADSTPASDMRQLFNWATRSQQPQTQ